MHYSCTVSFLQQVVLSPKILDWLLQISFKYVRGEVLIWRHEKCKLTAISNKHNNTKIHIFLGLSLTYFDT